MNETPSINCAIKCSGAPTKSINRIFSEALTAFVNTIARLDPTGIPNQTLVTVMLP
ncbi:MAG TPA: hypothetical protein VMU69_25880 [Bradyrhizobium sp.]|nr:hypothetical protein [Bradyrhizobium sp.]